MKGSSVQTSNKKAFLDTIQPFWIGGLSGMIATSVIQPLDMIKVVIQVKSETSHGSQGIRQRIGFFSIAK